MAVNMNTVRQTQENHLLKHGGSTTVKTIIKPQQNMYLKLKLEVVFESKAEPPSRI